MEVRFVLRSYWRWILIRKLGTNKLKKVFWILNLVEQNVQVLFRIFVIFKVLNSNDKNMIKDFKMFVTKKTV